MTEHAQRILAIHFPELSRAVLNPVTDAGFSGAKVFQITTGGAAFCWKCWPQNQSAKRLIELHRLLLEIAQQDLAMVPVPRRDITGRSVISESGRLWQLEAWMPGQADYWQNPQVARLQAAFDILARWHRAANSIEWRSEWFYRDTTAPAPTITDRVASLRDYVGEVLQNIETGIIREQHPAWREHGQIITAAMRWHGPKLLADLAQSANQPVPIQPVIRDVWHDHVLFTGNNVTGFIDYGAARTDTVTADISRLLGSLIGADTEQRRIALAAYEAVRPLSLIEHRLIPLLDLSNVLLSGLIWLRRRYVEQSPILSESRVLERLNRIATRLSKHSTE